MSGVPVGDLPWVHIPDPDSPELDEIARQENFHELDVEDCRHHRQIAKRTEHDNYTFLVAKALLFNREDLSLRFEDFNIFIKADHIVTVPEGKNEVLGRASGRLAGAARPVAVPKLVYTILDVVVDEYLPALYRIGEEIDDIEDAVLENPAPQSLQRIFHLRRMLIEFRRNTIMMRDLLSNFVRNQEDRPDPLYLYYRDIYEHLIRTIDLTETYRDLLTGALDIYLSAVANRTNEVMKILTIYGTIAIPMLVITSVYGMNVKIPGEQGAYAFWLVLGLMGISTLAVLWYFRRKQWW
ncbi:MAG: magnesium/cobalt transporter CorA [Acidobacteria bacterium]|nr:magnesium/cobalt transporter CorA [Acidobacteriota bacterium]